MRARLEREQRARVKEHQRAAHAATAHEADAAALRRTHEVLQQHHDSDCARLEQVC